MGDGCIFEVELTESWLGLGAEEACDIGTSQVERDEGIGRRDVLEGAEGVPAEIEVGEAVMTLEVIEAAEGEDVLVTEIEC